MCTYIFSFYKYDQQLTGIALLFVKFIIQVDSHSETSNRPNVYFIRTSLCDLEISLKGNIR